MYTATVTITCQYFDKHRGLALGLISTGRTFSCHSLQLFNADTATITLAIKARGLCFSQLLPSNLRKLLLSEIKMSVAKKIKTQASDKIVTTLAGVCYGSSIQMGKGYSLK